MGENNKKIQIETQATQETKQETKQHKTQNTQRHDSYVDTTKQTDKTTHKDTTAYIDTTTTTERHNNNNTEAHSVDVYVTWVNLPVISDPVSVHDVLESRGELIGLVEGGRSLLGGHPVENGGHCGATPLL